MNGLYGLVSREERPNRRSGAIGHEDTLLEHGMMQFNTSYPGALVGAGSLLKRRPCQCISRSLLCRQSTVFARR